MNKNQFKQRLSLRQRNKTQLQHNVEMAQFSQALIEQAEACHKIAANIFESVGRYNFMPFPMKVKRAMFEICERLGPFCLPVPEYMLKKPEVGDASTRREAERKVPSSGNGVGPDSGNTERKTP
ncbi:MAG: hypothetical protein WC712_09470 [Candidatus Brocadiia bacterium]